MVRPGSTAEVSAVLRLCGAAGAAVVPQGGNTGLVGGSVPLDGEIVLSMRRLDALEPVDVLAGQVTAGAGATLESVQQHAGPHGLEVASTSPPVVRRRSAAWSPPTPVAST